MYFICAWQLYSIQCFWVKEYFLRAAAIEVILMLHHGSSVLYFIVVLLDLVRAAPL